MKKKIKGKVYDVKRIGQSPYFISRCGEIISKRNNMILKGGHSNGYRMSILSVDGKHEVVRHHVLVLRYFIGMRPLGMVINHKNGIKTDNKIENLEYCTPKQNSEHAKLNKFYFSGSRCPWSKLTEENVKLIKTVYKLGMSMNHLARAYKVDKVAIRNAIIGKTWKYAR